MSADRSRVSGPSAGILLFSLGIFFFALNDALGKWLVSDYTVGQIMFVRSLGAAAVILPFAWRSSVSLRLRGQWAFHALRVVCMTVDSFAFYYATKYLPLADVMTYYLAAPLIITALSVPLLGEKVGLFRWSAVLVGFIGVVLALHPTSAAFSPAALVALFGSSMFAVTITITRRLRDTHWLPLTVWQIAGAGLAGGVASTHAWLQPGLVDFSLMALVGIISMGSFICIIKALQLVDASAIAPFQYVSIVWAIILGWLIWGDIPDTAMAAGIVIIVASGLVLWWREQKRATVLPSLP